MIPGFLLEGSPSVPASPPGCRSGGRGQGVSNSHHTFQSLPGQKYRTSAQLSYHFNHGSSRTKSARPCETGSELGGIRGVCRAAEAGLPLSHLRVEAPLPVRPAGCFRPERDRVVPGLRVTFPEVAPERGSWGSRPEGPGTQPWRPWSRGPGRGRGLPRAPGPVPGAVLCGQVARLRPCPWSWSAYSRAC